jgi:magnesium transporter
MIPKVIASFYGMNVPNALQDNLMGLWILVLVSIMLSGVGVFLFKRRRWF